MADRVTKEMLNKQVDWLNRVSGGDYCLGWAYGGVRVEAERGARDITRRGSKRDISDYLLAMIAVIERYQGSIVTREPETTPQEDRTLVDATDACRLTGLAKPTLYKLARERHLRSFKVLGRSLRFDRADLLRMVEERPARQEEQTRRSHG